MFLSRLASSGRRVFQGSGVLTMCSRSMSAVPNYEFEFLKVTQPKEFVYQVELNRPDKRNAMTIKTFNELTECFAKISTDGDCRVVVLSGAGKMFCAGIDLFDLINTITTQGGAIEDAGRKGFAVRSVAKPMQDGMSGPEKCLKPVIAAIKNACIGAGVDFVSACDIRFCTQDAYFQIKEVEMGLAADIGTLQRFPKIVGNDSLVRELVYTARKMPAEEAKELGLVSRIYPDVDALMAGALELASDIASKSPVAVQGSKVNLIYSRDHSVDDGLNYVLTWNQGMLQSEDVVRAAGAAMSKEKAVFSKL